MAKPGSNKKFYIILGTIIFFGVSLLALGFVAVQNQASQNSSVEPDTSIRDRYLEQMEQSAQEVNQEAYEECIEDANKKFNDYVAKIPENLTIEEKGVARESFADLRDSNKDDCKSHYKM